MGVGDKTRESDRTIPSSIRHKRILDLATEQPDASLETIAEEVPSATTDLVATVLETYGDPAEEPENPSTGDTSVTSTSKPDQRAVPPTDGPSMSTESFELTSRQEEILQVIAAHPEASQREIGEQLGVTGATVCSHMSQLGEEAWKNRHQIANAALPSRGASVTPEMLPTATDGSGIEAGEDDKPTGSAEVKDSDQIEQLQARIETLEQQLSTDKTSTSDPAEICDPELLQKVLHACLNADTISEEEELQLIKMLM